MKNQLYHLTNNFDFIISETLVWYFEKIENRQQKNKFAKNIKADDQKWKIANTKIYNNLCEKYIKNKMNFEWNLLKKVFKHVDYKNFINFSICQKKLFYT